MGKILSLHISIGPLIALIIGGFTLTYYKFQPWNYVLWALAGIWLIGSLIYNSLNYKRMLIADIQNDGNIIDSLMIKNIKSYCIISILRKMDIRLLKLTEKEKEKIKDSDWQKYLITCKKIIELMNVTVPVVTDANEAKKEVENFERAMEEKYLKKKEKRSKRIIIIRSISRLLDSDGFGLKKQRSKDNAYLRLIHRIDKYYDKYKDIIDKEFSVFIKIHKDYSEARANALLVKYRMLFLMKVAETANIPNLLPPQLQADIEGFEDDTEDILKAIRIDIFQYIKARLNKRENK
jgi:hypothetical protein